MPVNLKSIIGRKLGMAPNNSLVSNGIQLSAPAVNATITVGAEATDVRAITIQLLDANGDDITSRQVVDIIMLLDANGDAEVVTGGSTGIEIGTDGALMTLVAKKQFKAITEDDGDLDLTWTDTGTEVAYLGLLLPSGRLIISDALTNT